MRSVSRLEKTRASSTAQPLPIAQLVTSSRRIAVSDDDDRALTGASRSLGDHGGQGALPIYGLSFKVARAHMKAG